MTFRIKGATVVNDNREVTVNSATATANDRVFVGVTATNSPTSALSPSIFQGSVSGYVTAGSTVSPSSPENVIEKFPFSSDSNGTDVGDLAIAVFAGTGQSSTVSGYNSGGVTPINLNNIQKFPFATDTNGSLVGNLTRTTNQPAGQSSETHGYTSGSPGGNLVIDKFPFAFDGFATRVGELTRNARAAVGQSSATHGYTSGGRDLGTPDTNAGTNTIDKFPFATDTNATNVGDLTVATTLPAGQSSTTHGYTTGGSNPPVPVTHNTIDKFLFATDSNATDVGDLVTARGGMSGQSSTTFGYATGGIAPGGFNTIEKFPFASDTNATDIGNLTAQRIQTSGQQARTLQ